MGEMIQSNCICIVDLPMEMLFEIVSFLPNKMPFSLTCKKFYQAIWHHDIEHFLLKVDDDDFVRLNFYKIKCKSEINFKLISSM